MAFQSPRFERACVPKISPQRLLPNEVAVAPNVLRLQLLPEIARPSGQANPIEIVPPNPYCPFGQSMTGWLQVDQIIHLTGMAGLVAVGLDLPVLVGPEETQHPLPTGWCTPVAQPRSRCNRLSLAQVSWGRAEPPRPRWIRSSREKHRSDSQPCPVPATRSFR